MADLLNYNPPKIAKRNICHPQTLKIPHAINVPLKLIVSTGFLTASKERIVCMYVQVEPVWVISRKQAKFRR